MSLRHPARASLLAMLLGLLALMCAADLAAAQAGTSCRGSGARGGDPATADYEPVVANANADPCVTDEAQSARTAPQNGLTAVNPKANTVRSAGLVGASASVDNVSGTAAGTVPIAVYGEAIAGGDPCLPLPGAGGGGTGGGGTGGSGTPNACPKGAEYVVADNLCVIRSQVADGRVETIVVGRPFEGPSGGSVISLSAARKRFGSKAA